MKFNINDYKGKYVMHCKTEEEAKDFRDYMAGIGKPITWSLSCYCGENVTYFNKGTWGSIEYAEKDGYTILEWSDFMNGKFTKADLRTGDVIRRRNGSVEILNRENGNFICKNGGWNNFLHIREDLTDYYMGSAHDIIEVRRPKEPCDCCFDAMKVNAPRGILVYERKEVEEMTLAEVCRLLGKEIKIVK